MRKLWIPIAAGLVAVVLFLLLVRLVRPPSQWQGASTTRGRPVSTEVEESFGEEGTGAEELSSDPGALPPEFYVSGASLYGTVYNDSGQPISGAQVILKPLDDLAQFDFELSRIVRERLVGRGRAVPTGVAASATTDSEGRYAIEIASLHPATYQVMARHPDYVPQSETWVWSPEPAEIDFRLGSGETITGRVLDAGKRPIAGAIVEAFSEEGRPGPPGFGSPILADRDSTDSEGRFRLAVAGGRYRVAAGAPGFSRSEVDDVYPGTKDLEIYLMPGRRLLVKVLDDMGGPISGAEVAVLSGGGFGFGRAGLGAAFGPGGFRGGSGEERRAAFDRLRRRIEAPERLGVTDAEGTVLFENISSGEYLVSAEKAGWVPRWERIELEAEEESEELALSLEEGRVIAGVVKDPQGRAVPRAFVLIGEDRSEEDAQARERMQRVQEIRQKMEELDPSLSPDELRQRREQLFEEMRRATEGMPGGFGGRGGPAFALAQPADRPQPVMLLRAHAACETDRRGRFRFDTLQPGRYSLSVQSDRFAVYRKDGIELGDEPVALEIVLDPGVRLEGKVLSSADSQPIPKARIRVRTGFGLLNGEERFAVSDADGTYRISGLLPGPISEVFVDATGYAALIQRGIEVGSGPVVERDFLLEPAASISGVVTDSLGNPLVNALVLVAPADERGGGPPFGRMFGMGGASAARDRTDGEGKFSIAEVQPGPSVLVRASHPDFKPFASEPFSLKPGDRVEDYRVSLRPGGRIEVWVRDPGGAPIAGARVTIEAERGETSRGRGRGPGASFRSSGPDGKAVFPGLDAGLYRLAASARGFQPYFSRVEVADESLSTVAADLAVENAITGVVRDRLGRPVPGAAIEAFREAEGGWPSERAFAQSRDDGTFRLGGLGEGDYALRIRCDGFAEKALDRVAANRDIEVVLDLLGAVSGWAVTAETGQPIPRFQAQLVPAGAEAGGRGERGRGGGRFRDTFEDPSGAFLFERVPPGEYDLLVSASGHSSVRVRLTVHEGLVTQGVRAELPAGLVLVGLVSTDGGAVPVAGARVYLVPGRTGPEEASRQDADRRGAEEARADRAERRRAFEERRAERRGEGDSQSRAPVPQVSPEAIAAAVRGGRPLASTDETGRFELRDIAEGSYVLVVDHEALVPETRALEIREGRFENPVAIAMKRGESLAGTIRLASGEEAAGATVFVRDPSGFTKRAMTDAAGRYGIQGLVPGTYTFFVRGPGNVQSPRMQITIRRGSNRAEYRYGTQAPEMR